ncbi:MAG: pyridoxal phosphate-dependent aminotransferase [Bacteroides sp.]|nr:pyridoxal phosphate-dependent aminotransferase [Bacteroides sp.]
MQNTSLDFDTPVNRRGTGSYKWDTPAEADVIPMWVADMDFRTASAIVEALRKRVEHGVFGYTHVGSDYYDAVIRWFAKEHGLNIEPSQIIYTSGVVPAISAIIKALAAAGSEVIVQTPAYNCFFSSIRNDECCLASNPLIHHSDGSYTIDFDGLEALARRPEAKLLILCNPHNPSGRCWTRNELERVGEICLANGVFVVADEIHCELTFDGHRYIPFASISPEFAMNSATCISPSKAFNIAGLQIANIIAPDEKVWAKIDKAINVNEVCDVNPFGVAATIAAYNEGRPWLDALKSYLWGNYQLLHERLHREVPECVVTPLEATYLAWVDISSTSLSSEQFTTMLLKQEKLMLNPGTLYGPEGEGFVRINLATQRSLLNDAIDRIVTFVKSMR